MNIKVPETPREFVGREPTICDLEYFVHNLPSFMLNEMYNMRNKIQSSNMTHDDRATMCAELMYYQELLENLKSDNYKYGINVYKRQIEKTVTQEAKPVFYLCGIIPTEITVQLTYDFLKDAIFKNDIRISTTGQPQHITAQMFEDENYRCTSSIMKLVDLYYKHKLHCHYRPPDGQGYLLSLELFKDRYLDRLRA
jgi:hypothetical protein